MEEDVSGGLEAEPVEEFGAFGADALDVTDVCLEDVALVFYLHCSAIPL